MITKEKSPEGIKKPILVKLPFLLLIPLGLWLPSLASRHPFTVEKLYSRGIYPHIGRALGGFTALFGFSVAEFFVYFVILGVLIAVMIPDRSGKNFLKMRDFINFMKRIIC